jgi:hypothetical protein
MTDVVANAISLNLTKHLSSGTIAVSVELQVLIFAPLIDIEKRINIHFIDMK